MQAVILAAGMGSRLGKYTRNNTKCMLPVAGRTLIERALDALDANGITRCVIVVGYQRENLMDFLGTRRKGVAITYVVNDVYDKTNNIYSLYLARDHLRRDDTLLLESDLIFEEGIIREVLERPEPNLAVVAPYEAWMDGTMARVSPDGVITSLIPRKYFDYGETASYYKTVNIYKFSRAFMEDTYLPFLEAYCRAMGRNEYYEQVLRVIATLERNELKALVLSGEKWYEIDDAQDKDIAEALFCPNSDERLALMQRRYGGYWRFPRLLDFCYLVSPYFPPSLMRSEMRACFDELLESYPSGLDTQNLLMAKLFGVDEDCVVTGNGAAEIIRALVPALSGRAGVVCPTFNEYPESLERGLSIVPFYPGDINYNADDLRAWSRECDCLVLINPDNPSGNFIPRQALLGLLDDLKRSGKFLVLDESFIDFCDDGGEQSLLGQDFLEKYPGMVIVKSLSKSYGVPGLRLGAAACGDRALISRLRRELPIWNINSFAEYFLQIIGKYAPDYRRSLALTRAERRRFKAALEATGLLEVYPSQANFLLCRLRNGLSSTRLAADLLEREGIFIKDLTGKRGLSGEGWLRLALRAPADNDRLIAALAAL